MYYQTLISFTFAFFFSLLPITSKNLQFVTTRNISIITATTMKCLYHILGTFHTLITFKFTIILRVIIISVLHMRKLRCYGACSKAHKGWDWNLNLDLSTPRPTSLLITLPLHLHIFSDNSLKLTFTFYTFHSLSPEITFPPNAVTSSPILFPFSLHSFCLLAGPFSYSQGTMTPLQSTE